MKAIRTAGLAGSLIVVVLALVAPTPAHASMVDAAVTSVSEVPGASVPPVRITEPGTYSYEFAARVPAGGRLQPVDADTGSRFSSEVLVENAAGDVVGAYDAPYTVTEDGAFLPTTYRIEGTSLIQTVTVDASVKLPAYVLFSDYTPTGTTPAATSRGVTPLAATFVSVPSDYVYNPDLGSLHDYCTSSPDSFGSADFRGPCARHDLCYEAPGDHKAACDSALKSDLVTNCNYAYGSLNPLRGTCQGVANVYYAAVTAFGDDD
ncbi:phospholipase A2 [Kineosporia succinea]|uniref:Phospholipase A2-like protein n=1 Tax=Kineosporia succinea TaxID=84632 RepID=A0ABT9PEL9_9ACTN|nr:phospholipase A2 [Kineosporia succinea]MDP9831154.1 hypothetical protein [Kineosporia succinea]